MSGHPFLFGIDLEDVRELMPDGDRYAERVPVNTHRYLEFLRRHGARATFFTVGNVARKYPSLIQEIVSEGHEIASHGRDHVPLDQLGPDRLRADLEACREDFARAGADEVVGFRAPIASLVARTRWAYEILKDLGFGYSSSVLATRNPLYGWEDFGADRPRRVDDVWEIPVTLSRTPGVAWPLVGGIYFRVAPAPLIRALARRCVSARDPRDPLVAYMHPYDIDDGQERFMHPQINESRLYNFLLYWKRDAVFDRLEQLMDLGLEIVPYRDYVATHLDGGAASAGVR